MSNRRKNDGTAFDPSFFCITIAREGVPGTENEIQWNYVHSNVSSNYQVILEVETAQLKPGNYIIQVEALWNKLATKNPKYKGYTVVLHSKTKLNIEACPKPNLFLE